MKNNNIKKYHKEVFREEIEFDIFPEPNKLTKIKTSFNVPYLYILEPSRKRIIVIDKKGNLIKQLQSGKVTNFRDFEFSSDGKTIWPLGGLKVYKIGI